MKSLVLANLRHLSASLLICCSLSPAYATTTNSTGVRFWRGTGGAPAYHSFVVALDSQKGVPFSDIGGVATNFFPNRPPPLYHYNADVPSSSSNIASRIPFNNPIVGFGSRVGGSRLYINRLYEWGI